MAVEPGLSAERHAVDLVAARLDWLLAEGVLPHRGLRGVLTAARTQMVAAQTLIREEEQA